MSKGFAFQYLNENEFKKKESAVKKYNKLAYKTLVMDFYPELRAGYLLGNIVSQNTALKTVDYEYTLPADKLFTKVHGDLKVHFTLYKDQDVIFFKTISPEQLLSEGHASELSTYKGIIISKSNSRQDMFKIDLMSRTR